jgi:hypothetical protein
LTHCGRSADSEQRAIPWAFGAFAFAYAEGDAIAQEIDADHQHTGEKDARADCRPGRADGAVLGNPEQIEPEVHSVRQPHHNCRDAGLLDRFEKVCARDVEKTQRNREREHQHHWCRWAGQSFFDAEDREQPLAAEPHQCG